MSSALQETKLADDAFTKLLGDELSSRGYETAAVRRGAVERRGPAFQGRAGRCRHRSRRGARVPASGGASVAATCGGIRIHSLYVPNGREPDSDHYLYKLAWLAALKEVVAAGPAEQIVCGDMNIAPTDADVFDPAAYVGSTHVTAPERQALADLMSTGLHDVVRDRWPTERVFSYWDYRAGMFHQDLGMRIDLMLASDSGRRAGEGGLDRPEGAQGHRPERPRAGDHRPGHRAGRRHRPGRTAAVSTTRREEEVHQASAEPLNETPPPGRHRAHSSLAMAACAEDKAAPPPTPVAWTKVELPAEPVVLTAHGDELLIGLRDRGAKVVPRLLLQQANGSRQEIKVEAKSPYALEATWQSIAYDGQRLLALGGASGGAHSNTRWTVWTGSAKALTEYPQEFNTFGGQTAGALFSAVITPAGQALAGSWGSAQTGLDGAIWLPQGTDTWVRQPSAKTVLESVPSLLLSPNYGTAAGDRHPADRLAGSARPEPGPAGGSSLAIDQRQPGMEPDQLPELGGRSQGNTATCTTATACTISGFVDNKLAIWQIDGTQGKRLQNVPAIPVGDKDKLPPPIDDNGHLYQLIAEGNKIKVVSGHDSSWTVQESTGPEGVVKDAALVGKTLYLMAGPADKPARAVEDHPQLSIPRTYAA